MWTSTLDVSGQRHLPNGGMRANDRTNNVYDNDFTDELNAFLSQMRRDSTRIDGDPTSNDSTVSTRRGDNDYNENITTNISRDKNRTSNFRGVNERSRGRHLV